VPLTVLLRVEPRKVLSDDFFKGIPLDPLGARVPADNMPLGVQHKDRVVSDRVDKEAEALLSLLQLRRALDKLARALLNAELEPIVELLQLGFRLGARAQLALARLEKACIVDCDRSLCRHSLEQALLALGEHARLGVPEKESTEHLPRAGQDRHGKI